MPPLFNLNSGRNWFCKDVIIWASSEWIKIFGVAVSKSLNSVGQDVRKSNQIRKPVCWAADLAQNCSEQCVISPGNSLCCLHERNLSICNEWRGENNKHANVLPLFTNRFVYFFSGKVEELGTERPKWSLIFARMRKENLKTYIL